MSNPIEPLEDLCLDAIVENFSRYSLAFTSSKNDIMKRMLEFLQRKYSYSLLNHLYCRGLIIPEEYLDLLINKHLNVLESIWLQSYSWEKITFKMSEIGYNIQEINLESLFSREERHWQDIICYFPNLKVIKIGRFNFDYYPPNCNLILQSVARFCPDIEEINTQYYTIIYKTAKSLYKDENGKALCTKLKKLSLSTPGGYLSVLEYFIKNFKTLEIIENPDVPFVLYELHKNDLLSLDRLEPYNIRKLNFTKYARSSFLANIVKVCLSVCPHLKSVICGFVDELDFPTCVANLEELKIINVGSSEININSLLKSTYKNLTSLKIVKCTLSVSLLAESCPCVKELIFDGLNLLLNDDSRPVFNLLSCTFQNINVLLNDKAISFLLSSSRKLESIAFRRCNMFSSEIETVILKCCESYSVKRISFFFSEIRKEFLKELLLNCTTLKYLNIHECFDRVSEYELVKLTEILPNKPKISKHYYDGYEECDQIYLNSDDDYDDFDDDSYDSDFNPE